MAREVKWTRRKYELVCEQGMLSEDDCQILEEHIKRYTNQAIATKHNVEISVINDTIARLKQVYDEVQKEFPEILEKRDKSVYNRKKSK